MTIGVEKWHQAGVVADLQVDPLLLLPGTYGYSVPTLLRPVALTAGDALLSCLQVMQAIKAATWFSMFVLSVDKMLLLPSWTTSY